MFDTILLTEDKMMNKTTSNSHFLRADDSLLDSCRLLTILELNLLSFIPSGS